MRTCTYTCVVPRAPTCVRAHSHALTHESPVESRPTPGGRRVGTPKTPWSGAEAHDTLRDPARGWRHEPEAETPLGRKGRAWCPSRCVVGAPPRRLSDSASHRRGSSERMSTPVPLGRVRVRRRRSFSSLLSVSADHYGDFTNTRVRTRQVLHVREENTGMINLAT